MLAHRLAKLFVRGGIGRIYASELPVSIEKVYPPEGNSYPARASVQVAVGRYVALEESGEVTINPAPLCYQASAH